MAKFRKKPVVVEAVQHTDRTGRDIEDFIDRVVEWDGQGYLIPTLEGPMRAKLGDWIIKGVKGEFYPCKPDIFEATYEEAE